MAKTKFVKGPKTGMVMKVTQNGGQETYTKATSKDMAEAGLAARVKYGKRVKEQEKMRNPKTVKR